MPDDRNLPDGGTAPPHSARVKFASDSVRHQVDALLAESGGSLTPVEAEERRRLATRLRKAKPSAPLNLLPLLTLLLAACGKGGPDLSNEGTAAADGPESKVDDQSIPLADSDLATGAATDAVRTVAGGRLIKTSAKVKIPERSPEAQENLVRMCLKAITDNTLQPSAIHELCSLIDLDAVDRSHDVIWRWPM